MKVTNIAAALVIAAVTAVGTLAVSASSAEATGYRYGRHYGYYGHSPRFVYGHRIHRPYYGPRFHSRFYYGRPFYGRSYYGLYRGHGRRIVFHY